jgi:hypothetical protein
MVNTMMHKATVKGNKLSRLEGLSKETGNVKKKS